MTLLTLIATIAALLVVSTRTALVSVVWLIVAFTASAGYLALTGQIYGALAYILVYVGAIAVLFVFAVQLVSARTPNGNLPYPTKSDSSLAIYAIIAAALVTAGYTSFTPVLTSISDNGYIAYIINYNLNNVSVERGELFAVAYQLYISNPVLLVLTAVIILLAMTGPIAMLRQ